MKLDNKFLNDIPHNTLVDIQGGTTDKDGNVIEANHLSNSQLASLNTFISSGGTGGGIADAESDGKTYGRKDGSWVEVNASGSSVTVIDDLTTGGTTAALSAEQGKVLAQRHNQVDRAIAELSERLVTQTTPVPEPELTEINKEGEVQVNFFVPWKYAMLDSNDVVFDVSHLSWRFPYAEGRIKKISVMAVIPGGTKFTVRVDGQGVISTPANITNSWVDYNVDVPITYNKKIYISITHSLTAEDLHVSFVIEVGNKDIVFVGEPDLEPNVYLLTNNQTMTSLYMPSVDTLGPLMYNCVSDCGYGKVVAWFAKNSITGKMYIVGTNNNFFHIQGSEYPHATTNYTSFIEYPVDGVDYLDLVCRKNNDGTLSSYYGPVYWNDNGTYIDPPFVDVHNSVGISQDRTTAYFPLFNQTATLNGSSINVLSGPAYTFENGETIKDVIYIYRYQISPSSFIELDGYVLCDSGKIYYLHDYKTGYTTPLVLSCDEVDTTLTGPIKAIWGHCSYDLFALNVNNELYAKGTSTSGYLGLSATGNGSGGNVYNSLTWVGNFGDIKKIEVPNSGSPTLLLTKLGELYVAGCDNKRVFSPYGSTFEAFTRVYENYYFYDIVDYKSQGAYAICKKLGDMPSS